MEVETSKYGDLLADKNANPGKQTVAQRARDFMIVGKKSMLDEGVYPFECPRVSGDGPNIKIFHEGLKLIEVTSFAWYNYLGYSTRAEVKQAAKNAIDDYGAGAGGSPSLNGKTKVFRELETALGNFFEVEDKQVSIFPSGYGVNVGVLQTVIGPEGAIVVDQFAHACIYEGAALSGAKIFRYRHNNMEHLETVLARAKKHSDDLLICTEGLFSADGDFGKVKEIVALAKKYDAKTFVDEAHSMLVMGDHGQGYCQAQGVLQDVDYLTFTFSKGFGSFGGAVLASTDIANYLNWYSNNRMFSCALSPAHCASTLKSLELGSGADGEINRKKLYENAAYLRNKLKPHFDLGDSESWIIPVIFGEDTKMVGVNYFLHQNGLDISMMKFPAVSKNKARVRLFVTASHSVEDLDKAAEVLIRCGKKFDFIRNTEA